jgi:aminoglycoside 6'-N-acetyltransferase I
MRRDLWPGDDAGHAAEVAALFAGRLKEPDAALVAKEEQELAAFVELAVRHDIPGLSGKRVGYVEALYVAPAFRTRGIVRRLLAAARQWSRWQACDGFASDLADRIVIDTGF